MISRVKRIGYGGGSRRVSTWPIPRPTTYTNWLNPSTGIADYTWAKALIIQRFTLFWHFFRLIPPLIGIFSNGETFALVTLDAIGSSGEINQMAYDMAVAQGLQVPFQNIIFSSSHSHSGAPRNLVLLLSPYAYYS